MDNESIPQTVTEETTEQIPEADIKDVFHQLMPVLLAEVAMVGAMLIVFAVIGKFSIAVLCGAALGTVLELLNFTIMVLSLLKAEKADNPAKGQLSVRGAYLIRMLVLLAVLIVALKSGYFQPIATLLPLCFMRIAIFISQMINRKFGKKGESAK